MENNNPQMLSVKFLEKYKNLVPPWGFNGLGYIVYKRTYARTKSNGTTEEWYETVQRCIEGAQALGADYTKEEMEELYDLIFNLKCNFAGRMLWQLGTETIKRYGGNSLLNCWYASINHPKAFLFLFENLMLGGGVGYSIRREDIHELPKIKKGVTIEHQLIKDADFIVPDSRQGWVALLEKVLQAFYETGKSFVYSTIIVRGAGERIAGFGGTASGPGILIEGVEKIVKIFQHREGKKLRSIDVLDICNIIGSIVVAGNVRRSAEIALGDPDDYLYIKAKNWSSGSIPNWRAMSNNTIYADDFEHISNDVWNNGYELDSKTGFAKGEPYGFFNLPLSQKYGRLADGPMKQSKLYPTDEDSVQGTNPSLVAETKVWSSLGIKSIEELEGKTFSVINLNKQYSTATCWKSGTNKKVYNVALKGGHSYEATEEHKWPVYRNGNWIRTKTIDLEPGDKLPNIVTKTVFPIATEGTKEDGFVIGWNLGDGWITDLTNSEYRSSKNTKQIGFIVAGESDRKSNIHLIITEYLKKLGSEASLVDKTEINVNNLKLTETFEKYEVIHKSVGLPSTVWSNKISDDFRKGIIDGLFSSDGSVSIADRRITLTSTHEKLIKDVSSLLGFFGIKTSIRFSSQNKSFNNREEKTYTRWDLTVGGYENIVNFNEIFCLTNVDKHSKIETLINSYQRKTVVDSQFVEVTSVAFSRHADVWDINVKDDTHAFQLDHCITGNCGEISLSPYECCNLSELYLNNISSKEELIRCATLLYKTQKAIAAMSFIHDETNKIVKKNMRLGLGVTGVCQSLEKIEWLDACYKELRKFDKEWSKHKGYNPSIKLTTIKPSGTLSLLGGSTPGVHPAYSQYYIRRVRMSSASELVSVCREMGYHVEYVRGFDGKEDHNTVVVEFPCSSPEGTVLAQNMGVIEQLEMVKKLQTVWSDNAVSVTAYYTPEELPALKSWLKENYETGIKSVSFLLRTQHGFQQAPYEEISEEEYNKLAKKIKPLTHLTELKAEEEMLENLECVGGVCPIR